MKNVNVTYRDCFVIDKLNFDIFHSNDKIRANRKILLSHNRIVFLFWNSFDSIWLSVTIVVATFIDKICSVLTTGAHVICKLTSHVRQEQLGGGGIGC